MLNEQKIHEYRCDALIGVGDGGHQLPPNSGEKYFSGKHRVIFGQLIYFWKKEEQAPFIF